MVGHKTNVSFGVVIIASVMAVAVVGEISSGPRMIYEAAGFLVNFTSALSPCHTIECVTGSNCSAKSDMKCSKFTYCGEVTPNATSSSAVESGSLVLGDACVDAVSLGKHCENHTDCMDYWGGAYCSPETHVCTRARILNETCDENAHCAFPLECEDGRCVNNYMFVVNETCDANLDNGGCHLSLFCQNDTNMCVELPVEGEPCRDDVGCAAPFFCSSRLGKCIAPMSRVAFESCMTSLDCAEGLVCARNKSCIAPLDNYTETPKCNSSDDCPQTSYCHCDYVTGHPRCLPLPIAKNETLDLFNALMACLSLDPDYSVARCQKELVEVQRAINASAILDFECSRMPPVEVEINLLLLIVPVTILVLILALVVVVKLGVPKDK